MADILTVIDNSALELNYVCNTNHVSFSIADYDGNILIRGPFEEIENFRIDIIGIPKGRYMLCLIDGDTLTKLRFVKN